MFQGDNDLQVLARQLGTPPDPPSRHAPEPIPDGLDAAVLWCLEKDPARRPQAADELASALAGCRIGAGWSGADARAWWAAHPPAAEAAFDPAREPSAGAPERTVVPSIARA